MFRFHTDLVPRGLFCLYRFVCFVLYVLCFRHNETIFVPKTYGFEFCLMVHFILIVIIASWQFVVVSRDVVGDLVASVHAVCRWLCYCRALCES